MSCGVGCRRSLDPKLLWLWLRPAAVALIRPLGWEPPYAVGMALEMQKDKKKVDLVWFEYCNSGFPVFSIGMKYLSLLPHFQSICVICPKVNFL